MPDAIFDQTCDVDVSPGEASRALVPATTLAPRSETILFPAIRPDARFVAQLIAAATHVPQTHTLRRAAPEDAATTYSDVSVRRELRVAANGLALARVA
jgi:hypothetical protein